jgi:hypothetical protein
MMTSRPELMTSADDGYKPTLTFLARFLLRLHDGQRTNGEVDDLRILLETLPLSTDEFGLACNRVTNAKGYLQSNELGAAMWELRALRQQLQNRADAQPCEPRPRRQLRIQKPLVLR